MKKLKGILTAIMIVCLCSCTMKQAGVKTTENPGDRLFNRAESKFNSGEYERALKDYQKYLEDYPDQALAPAVLLKTGAIYSALGNYVRARDTYQFMIKQYPDSSYVPDGMVEILVTYYNEEKYREVIKRSYDIPEDLEPSDYIIRKYAVVGDAFLALGLPVDAAESFIAAYLKSDPSENKGISAKLMKALDQLPPEDIMMLLDGAEDDAIQGYIHYQECLNHMKDGRYDDALRELSEFIGTHPEHEMVPDAQRLQETISATGFDANLIGCLLPTSGKYESYGTKAQMGFDLAYNNFSVRENNYDIRVVYRDTESDPEKTKEAVRELAELGVAAIVGPVGTVEAAAEEAQLRGIPIITLTGKEGITETGNFVFRNFITRKMQVESVVSYAFQVLGLNNFAIMYPDEKYGIDLMELFWDEVGAYGGTIVGVEKYSLTTTDFAGPIKKIIGSYYSLPVVPDVLAGGDSEGDVAETEEEEVPEGPVVDFDAVFIPDSIDKISLILPQLSFYDVGDVYLLGTNLWHTDKLLEMSEISALGTVVPDGFYSGSSAPHVVDFVEGFRDAFGETPGFVESIAYDSAMMIFDIIGFGEVSSQWELRDRLLEIKAFEGVTGKTSFDDTGDVIKQLYLLNVERGGFVELTQ